MKRLLGLTVVLLFAPVGFALTPDAQEFISITKQLEPLQCEKRKLRREIALAEAERRDTKDLRARFAALDRDPKTSKLEKRLGELERRISNGKGGTIDPDDLQAISRQQVETFYRCEQRE
ncbi:MAG TPA: hypothetical protein VN929_18830 [Burkholderiales bacterium]|nr:hypothetical protein [Burkholderiales bacterium]